MAKFFISSFLLIMVLLEGTITTVPVTLLTLLILIIVSKQEWIIILAFFAGLWLDLLLIRPLGASSLFFAVFIFIVLLYGRKFEIQTFPFVCIASFLGAILYLWMFGYNYVLAQALVSAILAILLFKLLDRGFLHST